MGADKRVGALQAAFFNVTSGLIGAVAAMVVFYELPRSVQASLGGDGHATTGAWDLLLAPACGGAVCGLLQWALYSRSWRAVAIWIGLGAGAGILAALAGGWTLSALSGHVGTVATRLAAVAVFVVGVSYALWAILAWRRAHAP